MRSKRWGMVEKRRLDTVDERRKAVTVVCVCAVSYTHLDVYKRQEQSLVVYSLILCSLLNKLLANRQFRILVRL